MRKKVYSLFGMYSNNILFLINTSEIQSKRSYRAIFRFTQLLIFMGKMSVTKRMINYRATSLLFIISFSNFPYQFSMKDSLVKRADCCQVPSWILMLAYTNTVFRKKSWKSWVDKPLVSFSIFYFLLVSWPNLNKTASNLNIRVC